MPIPIQVDRLHWEHPFSQFSGFPEQRANADPIHERSHLREYDDYADKDEHKRDNHRSTA